MIYTSVYLINSIIKYFWCIRFKNFNPIISLAESQIKHSIHHMHSNYIINYIIWSLIISVHSWNFSHFIHIIYFPWLTSINHVIYIYIYTYIYTYTLHLWIQIYIKYIYKLYLRFKQSIASIALYVSITSIVYNLSLT